MLSRRKLVLKALGATLAGCYPFWVEPRWLDTSVRKVFLPSIRRPIRLVQISDLHASEFVSLGMIDSAIETALAQSPDLIVVTGDFISYKDVPDAAAYARTLRALSSKVPTFAVLGNHDGGHWAGLENGLSDHKYVDRVLEMAEIDVLHNRSKLIEFRGQPLRLAGVGDEWAAEMKGDLAFDGVRMGEAPIVLLSHNPDTKEKLVRYPWELMLSGHTHGGQVILPLYGPPILPVRDRRYLSGLKPWGTRQIHVTRGIGNLMGVRLGCRPEVSVLDLSPTPTPPVTEARA